MILHQLRRASIVTTHKKATGSTSKAPTIRTVSSRRRKRRRRRSSSSSSRRRRTTTTTTTGEIRFVYLSLLDRSKVFQQQQQKANDNDDKEEEKEEEEKEESCYILFIDSLSHKINHYNADVDIHNNDEEEEEEEQGK